LFDCVTAASSRRCGVLIEFLRLAGQSVLHRKLRSILAVLGVLIGIMAVVLLISFGLSLKGLWTGEISKIFGVDTFMIVDQDVFGGSHGGTAKEYALDLETLKGVEGVKTVAAVRQRTAFVQGGTDEGGKVQQGFMPVMGLSPELLTDFAAFTGDLVYEEGGRQIEEIDVDVAVLRRELADRLGVKMGDKILIAGEKPNEITATVIGILAASEEEEERGFGMRMSASSADTIYIPYATMDRLWPEGNDFLVTVVRILPGYDVDGVADEAEAVLKAQGSRVSAVTSGDITSVIDEFMTYVNIFLAGLAGISLLVGGVGVMNTMFTSVLERTKDIGVMKAVGAKNRHILAVFLIESGLIGLLGGVIGTGLGLMLAAVICWLINTFAGMPGGAAFPFVASPTLILATLAGAFALGAVSGLWPARRAARMPVVDALRYE
jgi:putative ABC transport system permease protein